MKKNLFGTPLPSSNGMPLDDTFSSGRRRNFFLLSAFFFSAFCFLSAAKAQTVLSNLMWDMDAPRQEPAVLDALGDDGYLYINAHLYAKDIANPRIEVQLPVGIDFAGTTKASIVVSASGLTPFASFGNPTLTGSEAAGNRKLVIYYTGNSSILHVGDSLVMKLNIRATCNVNVFDPGNFIIDVFSGAGDFVLGGHKYFQASVQKPTMRIFQTPGYEIINYANINDTQLVSLDFDAQNGYVNSTLITLNYNGSIIFLNNFKIDGTPLNLLTTNAGVGVFHNSRVTGTPNPLPTQTAQITYIRLDQTVLGRKIDDTPHILTFEATPNLGCVQTISTKIQNNLASACESWTGNQIVLQLPSSGVAPTFATSYELRTNPNIDTPDPKVNNWNYICYDGVTPHYLVVTFKNNNSAPTAALQFHSLFDYLDLQAHQYVDTTHVYFRVTVPSKVDGSDSIVVPLTRIPGNCYTYTTYAAGSTRSDPLQYAPPLLGTSSRFITRLPIDPNHPLPPNATIKVVQTCYANPNWNLDSYRSRSNFTATEVNNYNLNYHYAIYDYSNYSYAGNICGQNANLGNLTTVSIYKPSFTAPGQQEIPVFPNQPVTVSNNFRTSNDNTTSTTDPALQPTGPRYTEVFVKLPPWCGLNQSGGTIESAFDIGGEAPAAGSGTYNPATNTYSVRYYTNKLNLLNIKLLPGACTTDCTMVGDTMQIWADWVSGTPEGGCYARFKKTTKIWSKLILTCQTPAIVIEDFGVHRQTRGWRDSNNDHYPDDGTRALDNEMQQWHFAQKDTGYYYIKGYIGGTGTDTWDKLKAILHYRTGGATVANYQYKWGTTGNTTPFWNQATMTLIKHTDGAKVVFPLSIPTVTNQDSLIVNYDGLANDYLPAGGDSVLIKLPFVVTNGYVTSADIRGSIDVNTYGSRGGNPECNGYYYAGPIKVSFKGLNTAYRTASNTSWTFNFPSPCSTHTIGKDPASANYPNSPDYPSGNTYGVYAGTYFHLGNDGELWDKEVRNIHKLKTVTITVPAGFYRMNSYVDFAPMKYMDRIWATNVKLYPTTATENYATHDSIFVFDMSQLYDYTWNGSQPGITINTATGQLSNGKFPIGDDGAAASFVLPLRATPSVSASGPTLVTTFTLEDQYGTVYNQTPETQYLNYNGPRLYLETAPKIIYVNSQQLSMSSVKLQNTHGTATDKDVWLYVKGRVENAYLVLGNDTIWGQGLDNCWLKVGDMSPLSTKIYRLNFSYKGKNECTNDTIALFTIFDSMYEGFTPDTGKPVDSVNICRRGTYQYTILDVTAPKTKIAGTIEIDIPNFANPAKAGALHHNDPYIVDYIINGEVSQGALNDPCVTIEVPEGQVYTDTTAAYGVATFEYPEGSGFRPIPQAVRDAMKAAIGENSDDTQLRSITICAKDLVEQDPFMLPGWGADPTFGFTDLDRVVTIRLPMIPTCQTDLTGLRYHGHYYGMASCGKQCEDYGMQYISITEYTDVYPEYSFQVHLQHIVIDERTYTPDKVSDTLVATFKKDMGAGSKVIKTGDFIQLRMPAVLTVDGVITSPQYGTINVLDMTFNSAGERIYKLELPVDALNDSLLHAPPTDDVPFVYYIPVHYTPDPTNDCSSPRHELECQVVTMANFDEDVCQPRPLSIGSGRVLIINVNLDETVFHACLNMPVTLTVACGGVTPVWFRNKAGTGGQLYAGNTYVYTPTIQKDTTFYIRAVYDYGGPDEEDFGMAPLTVHMYPEVKAGFSADTVCLSVATHFADATTIGGTPADITNTSTWNWYLDGAATPFSTDQNPALALSAGTHNVTLKVTSINGCVHQITRQVFVRSYPIPTISGSIDECFNACTVYNTLPGMSNYQWTVDNGTINGAANADNVKICWDQAYSPTRGHVKVTYTDIYGCPSVVTDSTVVVRQIPGIAAISGNNAPCVNTDMVYSFVTQPGIIITDYIWAVTGGDIIAGGAANNPTVTVRWKDVGAQQISLYVSNPACSAPDTGKFIVNVQGPVRPTITGTDSLCTQLPSADIYTYETNPGMNDYVWHIEGGTITGGATSYQITARWDTFGTGKLAVSYNDGSCSTFTIDTFKVAVTPCHISQCALLTKQVVMEDGVGVGYYTHLSNSWDVQPLTGVTFDSVQYYINGILVSNGPAATLNGAQFPAKMTNDVMCVSFYNLITDTCRFPVTVVRACPATISDEEGNPYTVTALAGECWTSNLHSTLYPGTTTPIPFANPYTCDVCPAGLDTIFGLLYTWYSAVNLPEGSTNAVTGTVQGICPNGWHIPSKTEWSLLDLYTPKQLRSVDYWLTTAGTGTDDFGFTALPAGRYNSETGRYVDLYGFAGWWASNSDAGQTAAYDEIAYYCGTVLKITTLRSDAMSVRCIMD